MVTRVESDPLRIEFSFPDSTRWTGDLSQSPNPVLARELAHGLVQLVHPFGDVKRRHTAVFYCVAIRRMIAALNEAGFRGGVADLRKSHMLAYWMSASGEHVAKSKMLLKGCGDQVDADLRAYAEGRAVKRRSPTKPLQPYSEREWKELESGLREEVRAWIAVHRETIALAKLGPDPSDRGMNRQNLSHLLLEHGPLTVTGMAGHLDISGAVLHAAKADLLPLRNALYPTVHEVFAFRMLFGVYSGVVPDGIRDVRIQDVTWAGSRTVLMAYDKHRRGIESVNLASRAVRLLEAWMEVSGPIRRYAQPETADSLWIFRTFRGEGPKGTSEFFPIVAASDLPGSGNKPRARLAKRLGLLSDGGEPLLVHSARVRTTYHNVLSRKGWTGRTTIDPNHSARVEGDHYVSALTPAQTDAVEAIIEDAQADLLRRARPALVLTDEEAAAFAGQHPGEVTRLGLDEGALAELLGGEMDVFTAACSNQLAGEHGPAGKPCPARPWVCLLCPLAVFLPRHLPNLLRLRAYFARQSRRMTTDQFLAVFGPYADRLDRDILPRFPAGLLEAAARDVQDTDSELPLRPEEGSE
ncbi:hypothetical protein ACFV1F_03565 [Streptomyces sp. NPDC059590]|uniref:hypothetical protein n=1 Tax=Streptomyces sp. NPDC059590 TaxID=3346877 RepID=UPI00368A2C37